MTGRIDIDGTEVSEQTDCYVVAEVGCNHAGDVGIAKQMLTHASFSGANAVKLQKRNNAELFKKGYDPSAESRYSGMGHPFLAKVFYLAQFSGDR